MAATKYKYLVEVEKAKEAKDGKPSQGPVYRSLFTKDGFPPELLKTFPGAAKYLKTLVSFGNVTPEQEETLGQYGVTLYSWSEFSSGWGAAFARECK